MSNLNLFINLKISALEKSINDNIPAELFNNEATTGKEEVKVQALKSGSVQLKVEPGNILYYLVPIKILAAKDIGLTVVQASGEIMLVFKTKIEINKDWTITPTTAITDYKWTEKPVLRVGFIKLPIESIVTNEIQKRRQMIYDGINEQIKNALNLQPLITAGQEHLKAPIRVAETPQVWLKIHPQELKMTPLTQAKGRISLILGAKATVNAFVGEKLKEGDMIFPQIPSLQMVETMSKQSLITVPVGLTYEEITKLVQAQAKGKTFNWKQFDIKVEDIQLTGKTNRLVNKIALSGSLNGLVTVESTPVFNVAEQIIEMMEIELSFETTSFMQRNLFSMAEGMIKKQLAKFTTIDLKPHLKNAVKPLAYQKLMDGIVLMTQFSELSIQKVQLMPEGMMADGLAKGKIVVMVEKLP